MSNTLQDKSNNINLLTLLPKLCHRGAVAVRPSKTGVRIFVANMDNGASLIKMVLKNDGYAECRSIDLNTKEETPIVWSDFEQEIAESYGNESQSELNAAAVAELCHTYIVGVRPSKTGVRLYLADKVTDEVVKARFLTDDRFDFETCDEPKTSFVSAKDLLAHIACIEVDGH